MIKFISRVNRVKPDMLEGFFDGWKFFPTAEEHIKILKKSDFKIIAIDEDKNKVAGFITAISDNVLSAYIPLLEVLPEYQNKGIGSELLRRMLVKLKNFYMIDAVCDESLQKFYEKFGMKKHSAMIMRNYNLLSKTYKK